MSTESCELGGWALESQAEAHFKIMLQGVQATVDAGTGLRNPGLRPKETAGETFFLNSKEKP